MMQRLFIIFLLTISTAHGAQTAKSQDTVMDVDFSIIIRNGKIERIEHSKPRYIVPGDVQDPEAHLRAIEKRVTSLKP